MGTGTKKSFGAIFSVALLATVSAGCAALPLWVGAGVVGVVGGYAVSPDTVEGQVPRSLEETYDAAREIAGIMGQIQEANPNASGLVAMIGGARVTISLSAVNVSMTKLTVKARKAFMPKIDVAQDVYSKIVNNMDK